MKKINRIIVAGVCLFAFILLTSTVNAAEFTFGSITKNESGTLELPLYLEVGINEESFSYVNLDCSLDTLDVTCSFNNNGANNTTVRESLITYLGGNFPNEKTQIGTLVLSNSTSSQKSVKLSIKEKDGKVASITDKNVTVSALKIKSSDSTLKSLKVSQGTMTPEFSSSVTDYTIYGLSDTIKSVNITYDCNGANCSVEILDQNSVKISNGKVTLEQGTNLIKVNVTSEDGSSTRTYNLTVHRGETGYNSSKLASLSFGEYTLTPAFSADTLEYNLTVPNNVTSVSSILNYVLEDTNAQETLEGFDDLVEGENKATITIVSVNEDKTTTYTINIKRMSDNDIEILKYKDKEITFRDSDGIQTTLSEEDFKKEYPEEWERIKDGTYKFDDEGNIILDEEDEEKEEKKKNNVWLIILIVVVGLIIIGVSGFFIFKRKKNPEDKDENKQDGEVQDPENNGQTDEEKDIDESGVEEEAIKNEKKETKTDTMNIDEALVDLMSTKQYEFKDEEQ